MSFQILTDDEKAERKKRNQGWKCRKRVGQMECPVCHEVKELSQMTKRGCRSCLHTKSGRGQVDFTHKTCPEWNQLSADWLLKKL